MVFSFKRWLLGWNGDWTSSGFQRLRQAGPGREAHWGSEQKVGSLTGCGCLFIFRATEGTSWPGLAEAGVWHFPPHASAKPPRSWRGEPSLPSTGPPWRSVAGTRRFPARGRRSRHGPPGAWSTRQTPFCPPSPGLRVTNKNTPGAPWFSCGPAVQEIGCLPRNYPVLEMQRGLVGSLHGWKFGTFSSESESMASSVTLGT